jgi:hypothetical protein
MEIKAGNPGRKTLPLEMPLMLKGEERIVESTHEPWRSTDGKVTESRVCP